MNVKNLLLTNLPYAGHFQNMLTLPKRKKAIFSKFAILLLSGLFSVTLTTVLFGIPFSYITGTKLPVRFFILNSPFHN